MLGWKVSYLRYESVAQSEAASEARSDPHLHRLRDPPFPVDAQMQQLLTALEIVVLACRCRVRSHSHTEFTRHMGGEGGERGESGRW